MRELAAANNVCRAVWRHCAEQSLMNCGPICRRESTSVRSSFARVVSCCVSIAASTFGPLRRRLLNGLDSGSSVRIVRPEEERLPPATRNRNVSLGSRLQNRAATGSRAGILSQKSCRSSSRHEDLLANRQFRFVAHHYSDLSQFKNSFPTEGAKTVRDIY